MYHVLLRLRLCMCAVLHKNHRKIRILAESLRKQPVQSHESHGYVLGNSSVVKSKPGPEPTCHGISL